MITTESLGVFPLGMMKWYPTLMRVQILLGIIICNLMWSAHPLMGKWMLEDFTPSQTAWLRYTSALIAFWIYKAVIPHKTAASSSTQQANHQRPMKLHDWLLVTFLGSMTFCISPLLQFTGLQESRATDNALIIAMEPIMIVVMAWIFLRQRISRLHLFSFLLALTGFAFLAGLSLGGIQIERAHMIGNIILLVSLIGEATYSVAGDKLIKNFSPRVIYGRAILAGVISLTIIVSITSREWPTTLIFHMVSELTQHLHWRSAVALFWLGPIGTTATYIYWMVALQEASVASLALTLFIQPVFGSVWAYCFLNERLTALQAFGGSLILAAVFAQSAGALFRGRATQYPAAPPL